MAGAGGDVRACGREFSMRGAGALAEIIQCPFFVRSRELRITCERGQVKFCSREERRRFVSGYCACATGWEQCSLAKSLQESYDVGLR